MTARAAGATADARIPVTILTGFLGSGKTTLLNHVLRGDHGKRIVVIENEFGEVDIDGELVAFKESGDEDIMLLNNGCLLHGEKRFSGDVDAIGAGEERGV